MRQKRVRTRRAVRADEPDYEVGVYEAKTRLAELLDAVEEGRRVVITRRGVPIACLESYGEVQRERRRRAIAEWREIRKGVKPLGMTMKQAVEEGRRR